MKVFKVTGVYILVILALYFMIQVPDSVGLADNSDYARTLEAFDIHQVNHVKYLSYSRYFHIEDPKTPMGYVKYLFGPLEDNQHEYFSSHFLLIKLSLVINAFVHAIKGIDPHVFDLAHQTLLYCMVYAIPLTLVLCKTWTDSKIKDTVLKAIFVLIFADMGYMVYFNSFYGEGLTLVSLVLCVVLLELFAQKRPNMWLICSYLVAVYLFSGAKAANLPSALLMLVPVFYLAINQKGVKRKFIVIFLIVVTLVGAYQYLDKVPTWMDKVTTYHSVFFGVLKDHDNPSEAIRAFDLDPDLIGLANTHGYMENSYDIFGEDFNELFFNRVNKLDVLKYYVGHPGLFYHKLDISAEAALPLRPTYLSNVDTSVNRPDLVFTDRFSSWENIRKSFFGKAMVTFICILLLSMGLMGLLWYKRVWFYLLLRVVYLGCVLGQFIVPIVSNGEADLIKHMFLFNVHLDLLIFVMITDAFRLIKPKKVPLFITAGLITIIYLAVSFSQTLNPHLVHIGTYQNQKIAWYVIDETDHEVQLISREILYEDVFDLTSNDYREARSKSELERQALTWFSSNEQQMIVNKEYDLVLSAYTRDQASHGNRPHYWSSSPKYAFQNEESAYQTAFTSFVALPSLHDIRKLMIMSRHSVVLDQSYWLRSPYYSSYDLARYVGADAQVYHGYAGSKMGVRPVIWVKKEVFND